jgi:hypothetical protein
MLYKKTIGRLNRVKYAKKVGVNMGEGLHLYGEIDWGTEPWLITLGTNVHLTNNIRFINHDGGTLLFRDRVPDLEITKPINSIEVSNGNFIYKSKANKCR